MDNLNQQYQTMVLSALILKDDLFYQTELKDYHFQDYGLYFQSCLESKLSNGKLDIPKVIGIIAAQTKQPPEDVSAFFSDVMANPVLVTSFPAWEKWIINNYHTRRAVEVAKNLMAFAAQPDADANMIYCASKHSFA